MCVCVVLSGLAGLNLSCGVCVCVCGGVCGGELLSWSFLLEFGSLEAVCVLVAREADLCVVASLTLLTTSIFWRLKSS